MKTILVLTDFSKNARTAAETAIKIAGKMGGANILLFNVYIKPPFIPSTAFITWPKEYFSAFKEESIFKIKEENKRLRHLLSCSKFADMKITINYLTAEGMLGENVHKLLKGKEILLTIMGGREKTPAEYMFGDAINDVLSKVNYPVLLVNSSKPDFDIKDVAFATDLNLEDIEAIRYLTEISRCLHFRLSICHVSASPILLPDFNEEDKITRFVNAASKISFNNISYHNLEGNHIIKELQDVNEKVNADILAIVHRKHSFFWQIFHESPSKRLIRHQHNLLLILPEKWDSKGGSFSRRKTPFTRPRLQIL